MARRRQSTTYAVKRDQRYSAILREADRTAEQQRIDALRAAEKRD